MCRRQGVDPSPVLKSSHQGTRTFRISGRRDLSNRIVAVESYGRGCRYPRRLCFPMWSIVKRRSAMNDNRHGLACFKLKPLAHLTKGTEPPEFDQTMEVAKEYINGDEHDIRWIAEEVAPKLYGLAEQIRPRDQEHEKCSAEVFWPRIRCLVPRKEN